MAITVNSAPDTYSPVYNPVGFNISSTNYAQPNFNFVCDIYINSAATMTQRLKFPAYPSNNYGYVDIGGVLKDYLTSDVYGLTDATFFKNSNSILRYDVKWGEEYGASSGVTVYNNLNTSTGYSFNASLQHVNLGLITTNPAEDQVFDWVNYNSANFTVSTFFLTNSPRTINIKTTEGYALYFLNSTSNRTYNLVVKWYNSSGNLLGTSTINNPYTTVGLYDTRFQRVCVGVMNLASAGANAPPNTSYYTVYLQDNTLATTSETFRFNLDSTCTKAAQTFRFIFKNRMGAFDSFTFNGQNQRNIDIKKDYFKTIGGTWTGGQFVYTVSDRAEKQYNTITNDSFKVSSGWITQDESNWLVELVESPEVYVYHPYVAANTPVTIIDTNYTFKTTSRDQLFNLEMTFKPSFNSVRQQF